MTQLDHYLKNMGDQQEIDTAAGIRYIYNRVTEPLSRSIWRRVTLLWQLIRLRPEPYWRDEWDYFRQHETVMEKITSEHPKYLTAQIPNELLYIKTYQQSPWTSLLKECNFPENMGQTLRTP